MSPLCSSKISFWLPAHRSGGSRRYGLQMSRRKPLRWWICSLPLSWWWFPNYIHVSKFIKLYTLNIYSVGQLYLNKVEENDPAKTLPISLALKFLISFHLAKFSRDSSMSLLWLYSCFIIFWLNNIPLYLMYHNLFVHSPRRTCQLLLSFGHCK